MSKLFQNYQLFSVLPTQDPYTQCGNFMIFLSLRFYVKSILEFLAVQNLLLKGTVKRSPLFFHRFVY